VTWRGGTTLKSKSVNTDKDGNIIQLSYKYPDDYDLDPSIAGKTIKQGGSVQITDNVFTQIATMFVREFNPGNACLAWANHVNSSYWGGGDARTWKITNTNIEPHDMDTNPPTWKVSYEFT